MASVARELRARLLELRGGAGSRRRLMSRATEVAGIHRCRRALRPGSRGAHAMGEVIVALPY